MRNDLGESEPEISKREILEQEDEELFGRLQKEMDQSSTNLESRILRGIYKPSKKTANNKGKSELEQ